MQLTNRYPSQQPQTVRCTPQGNIELMTKIEILDFKPAPSAKPRQARQYCQSVP
jgi:hypothetical protein